MWPRGHPCLRRVRVSLLPSKQTPFFSDPQFPASFAWHKAWTTPHMEKGIGPDVLCFSFTPAKNQNSPTSPPKGVDRGPQEGFSVRVSTWKICKTLASDTGTHLTSNERSQCIGVKQPQTNWCVSTGTQIYSLVPLETAFLNFKTCRSLMTSCSWTRGSSILGLLALGADNS